MKILRTIAWGILAGAAGTAVSAEGQNTAPVTVRTNQALVGAAIGNGVTQGQAIVDVQSNGRPLIGAGALSGKVDHFGSAASVSVLNNARLVGVDGPGGFNSPNSVSVRNPKQAPVLSGIKR